MTNFHRQVIGGFSTSANEGVLYSKPMTEITVNGFFHRQAIGTWRLFGGTPARASDGRTHPCDRP
jgi:hypothetical protein